MYIGVEECVEEKVFLGGKDPINRQLRPGEEFTDGFMPAVLGVGRLVFISGDLIAPAGEIVRMQVSGRSPCELSFPRFSPRRLSPHRFSLKRVCEVTFLSMCIAVSLSWVFIAHSGERAVTQVREYSPCERSSPEFSPCRLSPRKFSLKGE